jgi:predicted nucleotidyltransferase component of viral defense system
MALDSPVHKNILFQILKDIYTDTSIAPFLGFKGGTAAFMLYGLTRFSLDLDFDLLEENKADIVYDRMERILKSYGTIKEAGRKRFSILFVLSYRAQAHGIKVEINRRSFGARYEVKTYLGIPLLVMVKEDMLAHKLMAMHERVGKTSRDIYDVWYFLRHNWPINREIVEKRAKMPFAKVIENSITSLEKKSNKKILEGLGELLAPNQKDWARAKLREDTIFLLKLMLESELKRSHDDDPTTTM